MGQLPSGAHKTIALFIYACVGQLPSGAHKTIALFIYACVGQLPSGAHKTIALFIYACVGQLPSGAHKNIALTFLSSNTYMLVCDSQLLVLTRPLLCPFPHLIHICLCGTVAFWRSQEYCSGPSLI